MLGQSGLDQPLEFPALFKRVFGFASQVIQRLGQIRHIWSFSGCLPSVDLGVNNALDIASGDIKACPFIGQETSTE